MEEEFQDEELSRMIDFLKRHTKANRTCWTLWAELDQLNEELLCYV